MFMTSQPVWMACNVQKCGGVQKCVMCCEMWCGGVVWGYGKW